MDIVGTSVFSSSRFDGLGDNVNPKLSSTTDVKSAGPTLSSNVTVGITLDICGVEFEVGATVPTVKVLGLGSLDSAND